MRAMKNPTLRLLIPFDGSDHALRACRYATRLSQCRAHLKCFLLYVSASGSVEANAQEAESVFEAARRALTGFGMRLSTCHLAGDVSSTIIKYAEEVECDVIVMGTRSMGLALGTITFGSVASAVAADSKVPVTLVK